MPSRTYELMADALTSRRQVLCDYDGYPRELCPVVLGHSKGEEKALTFQFDGTGSQGPVRGAWRCLELAKVTRAELADGPWRSGEGHSQPQGCVRQVDLDVNPDSPYDPTRRLQT